MAKPRIFVGSSREGLEIARAFQAEFGRDYEVVIWNQEFFLPGDLTLETLAQQAADFDFAVLVVTPDDMTTSRGKKTPAPRDNVLFELGLFMGILGRKRTYILHPEGKAIKWPSDLAGVTRASFEYHSSRNLRSSIGEAAENIRSAIKKAIKQTAAKSSLTAEEIIHGIAHSVRGPDDKHTQAMRQMLTDVILHGLDYEESLKNQNWPHPKKSDRASLWFSANKQMKIQLDRLIRRLQEYLGRLP